MYFKNFLQKILIALILLGGLQNFSVANAGTKIYDGIGYFPLVEESLDHAKEKAKLDGARNIAEQVFVDIKSEVETKDSTLERDEITKMTEGLMKILEVKYKILADDEDENNFIVQATVTAEVDTEELEKILAEKRSK